MEQITIVGLDLAKHVFQVHGAGVNGAVVLRKKLRREQLLRLFEKLPIGHARSPGSVTK